MVQAMNTGHEGSLSTCHANSPADALRRVETMVLMSDVASAARRRARAVGLGASTWSCTSPAGRRLPPDHAGRGGGRGRRRGAGGALAIADGLHTSRRRGPRAPGAPPDTLGGWSEPPHRLRVELARRLDDAALPWSPSDVERVSIAAATAVAVSHGWRADCARSRSRSSRCSSAQVVAARRLRRRSCRAPSRFGSPARPRTTAARRCDRAHRCVLAFAESIAHAPELRQTAWRVWSRGRARRSACRCHRRVGCTITGDGVRLARRPWRCRLSSAARRRVARRCRGHLARSQRSPPRGPSAVESGPGVRRRDRLRADRLRHRCAGHGRSRTRSTSCVRTPVPASPASSSVSCSTGWARRGCTGWRRSHEPLPHVARIGVALVRRSPRRSRSAGEHWRQRPLSGPAATTGSRSASAALHGLALGDVIVACAPRCGRTPNPPRPASARELADVIDLFALAIGSGLNLRLALVAVASRAPPSWIEPLGAIVARIDARHRRCRRTRRLPARLRRARPSAGHRARVLRALWHGAAARARPIGHRGSVSTAGVSRRGRRGACR